MRRYFTPLYLLISFAIFASLLYFGVYRYGHIILGGEGNFFLTYEYHAWTYGYSIFDVDVGRTNLIPNAVGLINIILVLIEKVAGYVFANFALLTILFLIPMYAVYLLAGAIGVSGTPRVIYSVFYIFGPFGISYLQNLNVWNAFSLTLIPALIYVRFKLAGKGTLTTIALFGALSRILSFGLYNPPTALLAIGLFLLPLRVIDQRSLSLGDSKYGDYGGTGVAKCCVGFMLFNIDWIAILLLSMSDGSVNSLFSQATFKNWGIGVSSNPQVISSAIGWLNVTNPGTNLYNFWASPVIYLGVVLLTALTFQDGLRSDRTRHLSILALICVVLSFGYASIFANLYTTLTEYLPYFYVFKTPTEKFGIAAWFLFVLILFLNSRDHLGNPIITLKGNLTGITLAIFILVCPKFISDYAVNKSVVVTREFRIDPDFYKIRDIVRNDKNECRVLSLPGGNNYQVLFPSVRDKFYSGLDPYLASLGIPYLYPEVYPTGYINVGSSMWLHGLKVDRVCYIIINESEIPWFGEEMDVEDAVLISNTAFDLVFKGNILSLYRLKP